jgi:hypothetical protein
MGQIDRGWPNSHIKTEKITGILHTNHLAKTFKFPCKTNFLRLNPMAKTRKRTNWKINNGRKRKRTNWAYGWEMTRNALAHSSSRVVEEEILAAIEDAMKEGEEEEECLMDGYEWICV